MALMSRIDTARAWGKLARARLDARDPLASQALDVARSLYAAVPEHDLVKVKPEEIIAGALLEFAGAHADAEREHSRREVESALQGAVDTASRLFARVAKEIRVDYENAGGTAVACEGLSSDRRDP